MKKSIVCFIFVIMMLCAMLLTSCNNDQMSELQAYANACKKRAEDENSVREWFAKDHENAYFTVATIIDGEQWVIQWHFNRDIVFWFVEPEGSEYKIVYSYSSN